MVPGFSELKTPTLNFSLLNMKISKWILACRVKHQIKKLVNVTQMATASHQIQIRKQNSIFVEIEKIQFVSS